MQLVDAADIGKLASLTPAALWVYVNAMVYSVNQQSKGYIPAVLAQDWSVRSCGGKPVAELLQRGLWRKQGVGFQILPSYGGTKRTDAEIFGERVRLAVAIAEKNGLSSDERTRLLNYHLAKFIAGEELSE